jgi:pimeloyl-ACP methyl ester carboxylesterase
VFDYGATTGLRLAMARPERVTAIVSQNGNAYEEGLGDAWGPIRKYRFSPTEGNRDLLRENILTLEGTRWRYTHRVATPESVAPELRSCLTESDNLRRQAHLPHLDFCKCDVSSRSGLRANILRRIT